MKNKIIKALALTLVLVLMLSVAVSCSQPCTHRDYTGDGLCDLCGENISYCSHEDSDLDGKCNLCGRDMPPCTHKDPDGDGKCNLCGGDMPPCTHVDSDGDNICDLCEEPLDPCTHVDSDGDNLCDLCEVLMQQPPSWEELIFAAESALTKGRYEITTSFTAQCDNQKYASDIKALFEGSTVTMLIDGDNLIVNMPAGTAYLSVRMIGNVVYLRYFDYETLQSIRAKAIAETGERIELYNMLPTKPRLGADDFRLISVSPDGKSLVCTELYQTVYDEVYEDMDISGAIDGVSSVEFSEVKMTVSFEDEKYDSLVIDYSMRCKIDGEDVNVTVSATMTYAYEDIDYVISPEDADKYKLIDFSELMEYLG